MPVSRAARMNSVRFGRGIGRIIALALRLVAPLGDGLARWLRGLDGLVPFAKVSAIVAIRSGRVRHDFSPVNS